MRHVLVIEDDGEVSAVICALLEDHGYRCTPAYSAAEATMMFAAEKFDLMLTGVILPGGGSGVDLVAAARGAGVACVVMSGALDVIRKHELDCGFLAKPFRRNDLLGVIESVLKANRSAAPD